MSSLSRKSLQFCYLFCFLFTLGEFDSPGSARAQQKLSGRTETSSSQVVPAPILVSVTVADKDGNVVPRLPQNAFRVLHDKEVRDVTVFSNEDTPVSVAIVIDLSGSMNDPVRGSGKAKLAIEALSRFVQLNHKSTEYFIVGFSNKLHLLLEGSRDAADAIATLEKINSLELRGLSALYDASYWAINRTAQALYPKRAILLITDGTDTTSEKKLSDVRHLLESENVVFYAINTGRWGNPSTIRDQTGMSLTASEALKSLANVSGGLVFHPSSEQEMTADMERIALEGRLQYLIGFVPAKEIVGGKCYSFKVKVMLRSGSKRGPLSARSRKIHCASKR